MATPTKGVVVTFSGLRPGTLIDWNGRLAQYRGSWIDTERPVVHHRVAVATFLKSEDWDHMLGCRVAGNGPGWNGVALTTYGGHVDVYCDDWAEQTVDLPVARPRDGREYGWNWYGMAGKWVKEYFPRCAECDKYHDPAFVHCEYCGRGSRKLPKSGLCPACVAEGNRP